MNHCFLKKQFELTCSVLVFLFLLIVLSSCKRHEAASNAGPLEDRIKSDERVVFFPTDGWRTDDGGEWNLRIHGWIFEPEKDSFLRDQVTGLADEYFEDEELTDARRKRFARRLRYFIADNEEGKRITIRIAGERILLPESDGDGRFQTTITLSADRVDQHATNGKLTFAAVPGSDHADSAPKGTIHLIPNRGTTVISDIDDTIKVSSVRDRKEMLRNTFLKPFKPVPGMAKTYREWSKRDDVQFLYLSNSPWQLYPSLSNFVVEHSFPDGPFDLLRVQLDDTRLLRLFDESKEKKLPRIKPYIKRYPERTFVLIGDSGEADPEIYGEVARSHPDRVHAIFIRNVTDEDPDAKRFRNTFDGVPRSTWTVFDSPEELQLE